MSVCMLVLVSLNYDNDGEGQKGVPGWDAPQPKIGKIISDFCYLTSVVFTVMG